VIRRAFVTVSAVALLVLVPFVGFEAWDYAEVHRLERAVAAIRARHEPVALRERRVGRAGSGVLALPYYRAAVLVAPFTAKQGEASDAGVSEGLHNRLSDRLEDRPHVLKEALRGAALHDGVGDGLQHGLYDTTTIPEPPDDLVARMRHHVEQAAGALKWLDAPEPGRSGDSVAAGSDSVDEPLTAALFELSRVAAFRTILAVRDGDAPTAARSIDAELRLWRQI
jgi:hypothetical protein